MDQTSSDNRTDQPFTIRKAETNEDLQEIAALADVIWHEHFTPIIGKEQVEYMLSRFQSYPALQDQVLTGYEYYRLLGNRKLCGYMAIRQDQDGRMFLSKLYIAKQYRGRHLAAFLFDFLKNLCRQRNCSAIWLTCNKHNDHSLNVYRHFGFQTIDAQKMISETAFSWMITLWNIGCKYCDITIPLNRFSFPCLPKGNMSASLLFFFAFTAYTVSGSSYVSPNNSTVTFFILCSSSGRSL